MRYLIIITLLLAASSCQKEISCEDWGVCDPKTQFKSFAIQERGGYDMNEYNLDLPYVRVNGFIVMIHPDYYASLADSITINLPDSSGEYDITEKFYYTGFIGEKLWAFQIGGTDQGWAGHEYSTYFALVDSVQYIERQTFNFKQ